MEPAERRLFAAGWVAVAALFALAVFLFVRGMRDVRSVGAPETTGSAAVRTPLPNAPLMRFDGTSVALRSFVGRPLWINFFATWCVPCKQELPEIEHRYEQKKSAGLVVLGVDEDESPKQVMAFAQTYGVTYPLFIDGGTAAATFDVRTIPMSVFVDASGNITRIRLGQLDGASMDAELARIVP